MPFEIGPLAAALVFSAVFLLGSKSLIPRSLLRHQRKVLSFGAGVTIAYVFVHLLPELEAAREVLGHNEARMGLPIPALRVYLGALIGFMSFYALRHVMEKAGRPAGSHEAHGGENRLLRTAHAGAFLVYVWLAGYLAVRSFEEGTAPIILYTAALGLHFLALDFSLSREYGPGTIARSATCSPWPRWPDGRWGFSWNSAPSSRRPSSASCPEGSS